jgi:uncharacterized RDD family membrane protein YckC
MSESPIDREDTEVILERIAAQIIDNMVQTTALPIVIIFAILAGLFENQAISMTIFGTGIAIFISILLGYAPLLEYYWRGQTLGKKAVGIRAVRTDGGEIGASEAIIRNLPIIGFIIPYFGLIFYPTALISIAASNKRQRLFDHAAKTVVVKEMK